MYITSHVHLESSAITTDFQLHTLRGFEAIERFFEFEVELVGTGRTQLDEDALLSQPATLVFTRGDDVERRIYGVVHSVRDFLLTESRHVGYAMTFVPRAWPMMHNKRSQIFLDVAVPDIIKAKLQAAGLDLGSDAEFRLMATYPTREFVMQYEETDLEFVSRLCEHLGISFFFEHQSGKDVIIFSDDNSGSNPIEGDANVTYVARGEAIGVHALEGRTKTIPAKYYLKDYNYRTPTVALSAQTDVDPAGRGDVLEYGAHFKTTDEGDQIVAIRAQELRATKRVFTGRSDVPRIACGAKFTLEAHARVEGELFVTEVRHEATQAAAGSARGSEQSYRNEFHAILSNVTYRPPRATPKPRVHGAISGVVEAEAPSQYAELDDQGRYHVRFMLDAGSAPSGKASSLLRMAQPHTGPGYGFHFPLRDGVEVMLTCIDGDPDRPIITGAVPNPTTPSTVTSSNGTRNVIRTGGGTEINIDDTDASTRFKVTVPFANTVLSLGAPESPEGFRVGTAQQALVETGTSINLVAGTFVDIGAMGGNLDAHASANASLKANGGNLVEEASGSVSVTAKGGTVDIGASAGVHVKGNPVATVDATEIELTASKITGTGSTYIVLGGDQIVAGAGSMLTLSSGALATLGATTLIVSAQAITITGTASIAVTAPNVTVTGSGVVDIHGGTIKLNT